MAHRCTFRRHGMTLLEVLIVILVLAILALIIIPRLRTALRESKESNMRANLQLMRKAITQFQGDTGLYPVKLADLVATNPPARGLDENGTMQSLQAASYKGPYLTANGGITEAPGIPANPAVPAGHAERVDENWTYSADLPGTVQSAVTGTTIDGVAYTDL